MPDYGFDPTTGVRLLGHRPDDFVDPKPKLITRLTLGLIGAASVPPAHVVDSLYPDLSHWDASTIDGECFAEHGIERAAVQADQSGAETARLLTQAGIFVDVIYCFPYFSHATTQPQGITTYACQLALDVGAPIVMFDAELDNKESPPSVSDRQRQTRECMGIIQQANLHRRIYSAPWWWVPCMNNTAEFYDDGVDFHLANYGANDDGTMQPIRYIPNFAWPYCVAHQYWSLADYCGRRERDMSYLWSDAIVGDSPMTPDERKEFDTVKRQLTEARQLIAMNGYGRKADGSIALTGEPAWSQAVVDGSSLFLSLGDTETDVRKLQQQPPGLKHHTHDTPAGHTGDVTGFET